MAVQTDPGKFCVIIPAMVILSCAGQSTQTACVCNILTDSLTVLDQWFTEGTFMTSGKLQGWLNQPEE